MEKRIIIKEDERNHILNLHRKYISEQQAGPQNFNQVDDNKDGVPDYLQQSVSSNATTQQTTTAPDVTTQQTTVVTPQNQIQGCKGNQKICLLQSKLNEKYKSGLVVDGKWGPKTAAAVQKAMSAQSSTAAVTTTTTTINKAADASTEV